MCKDVFAIKNAIVIFDKKRRYTYMSKPFLAKGEKVAVFGYNNIAQKHLAGLASLLGKELSGCTVIAGRNIEKAREMTKQYGRLKVFGDWQELLEQEKPKLVIIATPNFRHREMTIKALESGAHVLCEKPLGVHCEEVRAMYQVARDCNRWLISAMSTRYAENAQWLQAKLGDFAAWEFVEGEARYLRAQHIPGSVGFLSKSQAGGGALLDLGVHVLDLALWLWPEKVRAVEGKIKVDPSELTEEARLANDYGERIDISDMDVEYEALANLSFVGGGALELHVSWASSHKEAVRGEQADEIAPYVKLATRDKRTLEWSLRKGSITAATPQKALHNESHEKLQERYSRQIAHVARVVAGLEQPFIREQEMIHLHQIIDAIYISASVNGKTIEIR